ncbi:DUF2975 domain-containing protein [Nocardioides dongxiaopingii]|uniref:DUF2975 domain-containing protein n=1 Tax=Nocardioides sp. S-1144 TaxID=2582905 RepID=UPI00110DE9D3|nr:DUF2975 domain-containing protein [Nocardioides sp. S-1144]QCW51920.1 DUF2975 domain-containing protein [Nocardioides sp. S-1144]
MGSVTTTLLRLVLAGGLAGSLVVQAVLVPLLAADLDDVDAAVRWPVVAIVFLGIVTIQVAMVCVWRLVTMVRRDTVFSDAAFRLVDVLIGAIAAAAVLALALGVVLAPGEDVAPGVVLLLGGLGVLVAGVALTVLVMRALLAQATAMRTELEAVI